MAPTAERAAHIYALIHAAELNDVDPQACLADVLIRINDRNIHNLSQLLPGIGRPGLSNLRYEPASKNTASESFNEIATVRIELMDSDPPIWRQVEVPTSITLKVLHDIVQAAMGWFDCHLWEFTIGERNFGLPMEEDWGEPRRASRRARSACATCSTPEEP